MKSNIIYLIFALAIIGIIFISGCVSQESQTKVPTTTQPSEKASQPRIGAPPTVSLHAKPLEGMAPLSVKFSGSCSDPDNDIISCELKFGDGSEVKISDYTSFQLEHTYSTGNYTAVLKATDRNNQNSVSTLSINVEKSEPPHTNLYAQKTSGIIPLTVMFNAICLDPNRDLISCNLDLGDGASQTITPYTNFTYAYVYIRVGSFIPKLKAVDSKGQEHMSTLQISALKQPEPPKASLTVSITSGSAPLTLSFTASCSDLDGDLQQCVINYGDGTAQPIQPPQVTTVLIHTYSKPGTYIVTLRALDSLGKDHTDSKTIIVLKPDIQNVIPTVRQSIVYVTYSIVEDDGIFGQQTFGSSGSGVVLGVRGSTVYVITNQHVANWRFLGWTRYDPNEFGEPEIVKETIQVKTFGDGVYTAQPIFLKSAGDVDLMLLAFTKIKDDFVVANYSLSYPSVGDDVVAIGNPLGLQFSVSKGIVSNLLIDRTSQGKTFTVIQTDATVNPGNSGGGLFDAYGNLVGINTWLAAQGIGLAIHIKELDGFLKQDGYSTGIAILRN